MNDGDRSILIVGGGFSGSALAIQLAHRGIASTIIETRGQVAQGVAYSTNHDEHLLNVPAGKMSLWPDDPLHFADHVEADGLGPQDFVSRRRFGDYVAGELARAGESGRVTVVRDRAVAARPAGEGWTVELDNGQTLNGVGLVLANGNQPPAVVPVPGLDAQWRVDDPWSDEGRARIAEAARGAAPVLMMGTGLTMVDVALSLERQGFAGPMVALSRRGQAPRAHIGTPVIPVATTLDEVPETLSAAVRWLRRRAVEQAGWRGVIDGLRPVTQELWRRMDDDTRLRFMRHARPWWDVHRHRIAPQAAGTIHRLIGEGQLEILAGRATGARGEGERVLVDIAARRGGQRRIEAGLVVNCTGPLASIAQSDDPLIRQLLADGLARPDALGIGLEVEADDRLAGLQRAWGIGPVTKGRHWEIIAVPDIRVQADRIAAAISGALPALAPA